MTKTKAELDAVYLIYSAHRLLLKDALDRLTADVGVGDAGALDIRRFAAAEADGYEIISACQALSFLGGRRVVVINDVLSLDDESRKLLIDYVDNPNPQTILVMTEIAAGKQDERRLKASALFKACSAAKAVRVHEYQIKSGPQSWIKAAFAAAGTPVAAAAVDYLIAWVGADLINLKSEIDKLCAAAAGRAVTMELVKELAVVKNEAEVFDLINAVIDRDAQTALTRLAPLLEKDASGGHLFALLERQFQLILDAKTKGRGLNGQKLAAALGVSPGQAFHLEKQSRIFSLKSVKEALKLLIQADFTRKSSPLPTGLLLETLVVDLCGI